MLCGHSLCILTFSLPLILSIKNPHSLREQLPSNLEEQSRYSVQIQRDSSADRLDPCDKHTPDPCKCSVTPSCDYDDLTSKCITESPKFSEKLGCRRTGTFYSYGGNVLCQSEKTEGDCSSGLSVHAVNLNGPEYHDIKNEIIYKADSESITIDEMNLNLKMKTACPTVKGVRSLSEGSSLYGTIVEGIPFSDDLEDSCVTYPIPILQDGEYELIIKTIAQPQKQFRIKLGSTVAADVDLLKLAGGKGCTAVDIAFLFLVESSGTVMHIKGHQNSAMIRHGFTLKFCYGLEHTKNQNSSAVYRASAFSLIRFGEDTIPFEKMEMSYFTYGDGSDLFRVKDVTEYMVSNKGKTKEKCSSILKGSAECKLAGCEYSVKDRCENAVTACAGAVMGSMRCIRENSLYVSGGGFLCKSGLGDDIECRITKVIDSVSVNHKGFARPDTRGVSYTLAEFNQDEFRQHSDYLNLTTDPDLKCVDQKTGKINVTGVRKLEWQLYEGVLQGKSDSKECFSRTIKNLMNGPYELSIKTIEPFWTEPGKRAFDIKINDKVIVANLDIFHYVGGCAGLDLIIPFRLESELIVFIDGFVPIVLETEKTITVSFCPGSEQDVYKDTRYIFATMYLARLTAKGDDIEGSIPQEWTSPIFKGMKFAGDSGIDTCADCKSMHGDPKRCKKAGYEYDVIAKRCVRMKKDCRDMFARNLTNFCRRKNSYYVNSGVLCKTRRDGGDCTKAKALYGVNLGSDEEYVDKSRGIIYRAEGARASDPEEKKETEKLDEKCIVGGEEESKQLYGSLVTAKKTGIEPVCISYTVPICQQGLYELSLKMMDINMVENQSCFDIKVDGETVLTGVDIAKLANGRSCEPIEIVFPMYVQQVSIGKANNRHLIFPRRGYKDISPIYIDNNFELKFCSCDWTMPHPDFRVSAFSLVRHGDGSVPCDLCSTYNGEKMACDSAKEGCKYNGKSQKCSEILANRGDTEENPCKQHDKNGNSCKMEGCEFNHIVRSCTSRNRECEQELFEDSLGCMRDGAFYSKAGILCKAPSESDSSQCSASETIWAVNLNGKSYASEQRKINYTAEEASFSIYTNKRLKSTIVTTDNTCRDDGQPDHEGLWADYVEGFAMGEAKSCLTYVVPLCQDGNYELSLLMLDEEYKTANMRCFDVKINNLMVLFSIDLARNGECAKNEIIVLFKVVNSKLIPQGFPTSYGQIVDGKFHLSLCFGRCGYADGRFIASAFSVVRFGGDTKKCDKCSIYDGNRGVCEKKDCEYDVASKKCITADDDAELRLDDYDSCSCDRKGFRYNLESKQCSVMSSAFENKLKCRRAGATYAITRKHFCLRDVTEGDCTGETVYGLNLNGDDYVDESGRKYKKEIAAMYVDPRDTRTEGEAKLKCKIPGVGLKDAKKLYMNYIAGEWSKGIRFPGSCLSYPVPLLQDGEYELTIKSIFGVHHVKKTCFDIKINDIPVTIDIDLYRLGQEKPCSATDIILLFVVEDSRKVLRVRGHNQIIPISNGFHLQFCFGVCKGTYGKNYYQISAFSLFRFGVDTEIPNVMRSLEIIPEVDERCHEFSKEDPCKCAENDCRYDMFSKKCVSQNRAWTYKLKCRRQNRHYTFGSHLICRFNKSEGDCSSATVVNGANLGGQEYVDSNSFYFRDDSSVRMSDPLGAKMVGSIKGKCAAVGAEGSDGAELYGKYIYGSPTNKLTATERCVNYDIPLLQDGEYELVIKTIEDLWTKEKSRSFDVRINSVPVALDLDLIKLGGQKCIPIDIVALLLVDGSQTSLRLKGVTNPISISKGFQLQFCYGSGIVPDNSFLVSAFSLRRFGKATIIPREYTPLKSLSAAVAASEANPTNNADRCIVHKKDAVACKRDGCQYNLVKRQCVAEMGECVDKKLFQNHGECRRNSSFYAVGGVLCRNLVDGNKACANGKTVYAVNVAGKEYNWEQRGIVYGEETNESYSDPTGVRIANNDKGKGCGKEENDVYKKLFFTEIFGNRENGEGPITWKIPVTADGLYELSLWLVEQRVTARPSQRSFDVSINSVTVLFGVDLVRIAGTTVCPANEIIFLIEVVNNGAQMEVSGFPTPIPIVEGFIHLGLHFGSLGYSISNFKISAFSLIEFKLE